jgi:Flp pilus assembly protein TadD
MITIRTKLLLVTIAVSIAVALLGGCASGTKETVVRDEHMRMLDLQKKAEAATAAGSTTRELPELDARGLEQVGDNYVRQGNPAMAFVQYEKALARDPKLESVKYKKGMLMLNRGMNDEALAAFEDILGREPKNALALEGRGRVRLAKNDLDGAMADFDSSLAADPRLWQVYALRGYVYDQRKDHDRAIGEYDKAIALNSHSSLLYNNLGMSRYLKGDYRLAADAYSRAIRLDLNNRRAYNNLGLALFKLGHDEDALLAFKQGGDEAAAYNNMGCLYMADNKYAEAKTAFEKAIGMKPNHYAKARENLKKAEDGLAAGPAVR